VLGPVRATALVVGTIIGTGVFLKPGKMGALLGDSGLVLAAWVVAAILSVAGALTYAELGARMPEAGGEYAYLRTAYGRFPAFMFGWMRFWIGSPGSIAAFGVGTATFLAVILPVEAVWPGGIAGLAVTFIAALTLLNVVTVSIGSGVQTALTALKIVAVLGLAATLFVLGRSPDAPLATSATLAEPPRFAAFVAAVVAALWAFDGWNNMPMVGGEVKNPRRNIPLALIAGMAVVTALYLFADRAYFAVLTEGEVAGAGVAKVPVATTALQAATGATGLPVMIMSLVFVVSALGAMTGSILTGARVPYAMAKDGLFLASFARIGATTRVPAVSVVVQGVVACVLALSGSFDELTEAVVFASWIFYGLTAAALFRVRRLGVGADAAYRTPLWPVMPLLFIAVAGVLLLTTVFNEPALSALGCGMLAIGVPVYLVFVRKAATTT